MNTVVKLKGEFKFRLTDHTIFQRLFERLTLTDHFKKHSMFLLLLLEIVSCSVILRSVTYASNVNVWSEIEHRLHGLSVCMVHVGILIACYYLFHRHVPPGQHEAWRPIAERCAEARFMRQDMRDWGCRVWKAREDGKELEFIAFDPRLKHCSEYRVMIEHDGRGSEYEEMRRVLARREKIYEGIR